MGHASLGTAEKAPSTSLAGVPWSRLLPQLGSYGCRLSPSICYWCAAGSPCCIYRSMADVPSDLPCYWGPLDVTIEALGGLPVALTGLLLCCSTRGKGKGLLEVHKDTQLWSVTHKGRAVYDSSLPLDLAMQLYDDLKHADEGALIGCTDWHHNIRL
jgi:hypothetical protein